VGYLTPSGDGPAYLDANVFIYALEGGRAHASAVRELAEVTSISIVLAAENFPVS